MKLKMLPHIALVLVAFLSTVNSIYKGHKESNDIEEWEFTRQSRCEAYTVDIRHMSCDCLEHFSARNVCESFVDFKDLKSLPRCRKLEFCHPRDMKCHCLRNFCAMRARCYVLWKSILSMKYVDYLLEWMANCNEFGSNSTANDIQKKKRKSAP